MNWQCTLLTGSYVICDRLMYGSDMIKIFFIVLWLSRNIDHFFVVYMLFEKINFFFLSMVVQIYAVKLL